MRTDVHQGAKGPFTRQTLLLAMVLLTGSQAAPGQGVNATQTSPSPATYSSVEMHALRGHVPAVVARLSPIGPVAATNQLRMAIGVLLRDPAGLEAFLVDIYNPSSPNYHQYLTPEEFTARFGPTEQDYQAVKDFALASGFKITAEHGNRLLLDVVASAADVERAFHVALNRFQHPTEAREFFAPDAEPTVDAALRVADVQGLSNYGIPRPTLKKRMGPASELANGGTGPNTGGYFGNDFRNAYVPGTTLTGAGQMVGLFQGNGFYASDIAAYAQQAGGGRTSIVIQTVLLDGFDGVPTSKADNGEVSLDIEMAMAMAPGLSKIIVFETNPLYYVPNDVLNAMVSSNMVKNLSSSWSWDGGPTTTQDTIFQEMAAQGQSYFNASGDWDAFVHGSSNDVDNHAQTATPMGCPYITQVGGTTLTMNGSGVSYASETVWNWGTTNNNGGYWGSSGGVSTNYSIPWWQTNISMGANGGSTFYRNIPDVALPADNIEVFYWNGTNGNFGGTSCAAPLWAGFMALVNQQATALGHSSAGFINPAVYAIGEGLNPNYSYAGCFHDITTGNNAWPASAGKYVAVAGYDLCTGWGTPAGTNLINALAGTTVASGVDHFAWSTIASPQAAGTPFTVTLTAQTAANATATNFTSTVALSGSGGGGGTNMLWSDGFENGSLSDWTLEVPYDYYLTEILTYGAAAGNACLYMLGGNSTPCDGLMHTLSNITPSRINFYVATSDTSLAAAYFVVGNNFYGSNSVAFFYMNIDGTMGLYDGTTWHGTPYVANQWYKISLMLNWTAKTIDYYVNDSLVLSGIPFRNPNISALTMLNLYNYDYAEAWYDEIEFLGAGASPLTVSPANSGAFVKGLWTGSITVQPAATNVVLTANDGGGHTGQSNPFNVTVSGRPRFAGLGKLANGQIQLTLSGSPMSNYAIYTSSDLKNWNNWTTVRTTNGSATFVDPATGLPRRFYRAMLTP